ncbi:hypothetical protein F4703DRAFT_1730623, partial [Phycomyces blakesleeanus]
LSETEKGTQIRLLIPPSDPDFPFDLEALEILLMVPTKYPLHQCSLTKRSNMNINGSYRNLELGYETFTKENYASSHISLVQQMDWLDKHMEEILQKSPAPTIRFVSYPKKGSPKAPLPISQNPKPAVNKHDILNPSRSAKALNPNAAIFVSACYTPEQRKEAAKRRHHEMRQLQTRFGTSYSVVKANGHQTVCSIHIQWNDLDPSVQEQLGENLILEYSVPVMYPLEPCSISIQKPSLENFRAMDAVQFLPPSKPYPEIKPETSEPPKPVLTPKPKEILYNETKDNRVIVVNDRCLLLPPNAKPIDGDTCGNEEGEERENDGNESCGRCKGSLAIDNIQPEKVNTKRESWTTCPTCTLMVGVRFLSDFIHPNASTLGLLQLVKLSPISLVSLSLTATCAQCLTESSTCVQFNDPRILNQQCSACFTKMSLGYESHRYFRIGTDEGQFEADEAQVMKLKQKGSIKTKVCGQPLPDKGRCSHYRKSKRWFRFPCCQKLYPCNTCHDLDQDHPYTYAQRHVCGMCSREQAIMPLCTGCNHAFEPDQHKGAFWEGGQGMRDKTKMSRKDTRKHKGTQKVQSRKQDRVG